MELQQSFTKQLIYTTDEDFMLEHTYYTQLL